MDSAVALALIGTLLELGGLSVVAWEIRNDRRHAKKLFGAIQVSLHPARAYSRAGAVIGTGGREPTQEERIETLEADLASLRTEMDDRLFEERKKRDQAIDAAHARTTSELDRVDKQLRGELEEVLVGNWRLRAFGAVLIALGIAFTSAATVVANG